MRLLVVDDSNMIRTRISRVVQNGGIKGIVLAGLARATARKPCDWPGRHGPRSSPWT